MTATTKNKKQPTIIFYCMLTTYFYINSYVYLHVDSNSIVVQVGIRVFITCVISVHSYYSDTPSYGRTSVYSPRQYHTKVLTYKLIRFTLILHSTFPG